MGRKAYSDDLATAKVLSIAHAHNLRSGEDGEFSFDLRSSAAVRKIVITAMISDTSDYPNGHDYYVFAADDAPACISKAIGNAPRTTGKRIPAFLKIISDHLAAALSADTRKAVRVPASDDDCDMTVSQDHDLDVDEDDGDDDDDDLDLMWGFHDDEELSITKPRQDVPMPSHPVSPVHEIHTDAGIARRDLLAVKQKGLKVGVCGKLAQGSACFVNISCRISKLGISEEAMQAWSIKPNDYLILMLYYPSGYRCCDALQKLRLAGGTDYVRFRIALGPSYRPASLTEAMAFLRSGTTGTLREPFISKPLHDLFNERFLSILALRCDEKLSWSGAEAFYNESLGATRNATPSLEQRSDNDGKRSGFVGFVTEDAVQGRKPVDMSLPLVAMQYLLRHFCGCTWFCLVCHCKIKSNVEAIKPYVCDKPLCLYQYMNLGLGPSMDHEVDSQPLVVDLLISFCYAAAASGRIREYPALDWKVPSPLAPIHGVFNSADSFARRVPSMWPPPNHSSQHDNLPAPQSYKAVLDKVSMELIFSKGGFCPLKQGDWIVFNLDREASSWNFRVNATSSFPVVQLSKQPVISAPRNLPDAANHGAPRRGSAPNSQNSTRIPISFFKYDVAFDELSSQDKSTVMCRLLDTMPKVSEMKAYIRQGSGCRLENWTQRLSPAHAGLLRWIVASNRSCIMQVDEVAKTEGNSVQLGVRASEERVSGIPHWLQFRFAMGSPDKEARFVESLKHGNPQYPSLFAWHGSAFANWHSIVRSGLDFAERSHGRAFGDGVYHSNYFQTSMGYSGHGHASSPSSSWPQSMLSLSDAIALSEIVNAPDQFVSRTPHFVVQHTDWIQTRYLFARPTLYKIEFEAERKIAMPLVQDTSVAPAGPDGTPIKLPITAIPRARRPNVSKSQRPIKPAKRKHGQGSHTTAIQTSPLGDHGSAQNPIDVDEEDKASVSTLDEDLEILGRSRAGIINRPPTPPATPVTSFTVGPIANLPTMPPPTYATSQASMALSKAYKLLIKTQEDHIQRGKLAELGWYVDTNHVEKTENLYQWIICMHSFPMDIPLGQQMEANQVDSIVFELRFPANFPFSPPFIRVVRPRFLPYAMGGGGHVTAGGSICMDLLTTSGWNVASSIESVLLNIRMAILTTEPRPAQLEHAGTSRGGRYGASGMYTGQRSEYGVGEAVEAYVRACRVHGWTVPPELQAMTNDSRGYL